MKPRIQSIDILRGVVLVLMTLDHVREYFSYENTVFGPMDLDKTNSFIYFTRWITHLCAPTFVLLAGLSIGIQKERFLASQLFKKVFTRGLWLIFLELTLVGFAWSFEFKLSGLYLQVIWAIGASMVITSFFVFLPKIWSLIVGLTIIFGHNLLDSITFQENTIQDLIWHLFHVKGGVDLSGFNVYVLYPILPYIGIMLVGYYLSNWFNDAYEGVKRRKNLLTLGALGLGLFILLKLLNGYGDEYHWEVGESYGYTILSFLKISKYPPSLLFILIMVGLALILLVRFENWKGWLANALSNIGKVSLFYYVVHLYAAHLLALFVEWIRCLVIHQEFKGLFYEGYGYSLWFVYLMSILVVLLVSYLGRFYLKFKQKNKTKWWTSYI